MHSVHHLATHFPKLLSWLSIRRATRNVRSKNPASTKRSVSTTSHQPTTFALKRTGPRASRCVASDSVGPFGNIVRSAPRIQSFRDGKSRGSSRHGAAASSVFCTHLTRIPRRLHNAVATHACLHARQTEKEKKDRRGGNRLDESRPDRTLRKTICVDVNPMSISTDQHS